MDITFVEPSWHLLDGFPDEDVDRNIAWLVIPELESVSDLSENLGDLNKIFLSGRYMHRFGDNIKKLRGPVLKLNLCACQLIWKWRLTQGLGWCTEKTPSARDTLHTILLANWGIFPRNKRWKDKQWDKQNVNGTDPERQECFPCKIPHAIWHFLSWLDDDINECLGPPLENLQVWRLIELVAIWIS